MKSGGGFRARAHGDPTLSSRYSKFSSGQSAASAPRRHVAGVVGKRKRNSNESATQVRENTASQTPEGGTFCVQSELEVKMYLIEVGSSS